MATLVQENERLLNRWLLLFGEREKYSPLTVVMSQLVKSELYRQLRAQRAYSASATSALSADSS
jgi:hypothetical protein